MANQSHSMATLHTAGLPPRPEEPVPELAGSWPLIGHLREFQRDPVAMLSRGCREHGDLFRFRLGVRDFVLFAGPEAHDFYFRAPETQLNAKAVYRFTVPVFGRGVAYDTSPEIMAEQLGFLFPALREAPMRKFAVIMFEEASAFADALGSEGEIDLPHAMNELTVRIASRCLIGQEVRDRVDTGFAEAYRDLQKGINTLGFFLPRLPTPAHRSRDRARRTVAEIFSGIMAARRNAGVGPDDFMQTLMNARYNNGRALSDDEITGILLTVLFAGQHTSAVLATWTGLELFRGTLLPGAVEGRDAGGLPRNEVHEPRQPPAPAADGKRRARRRAAAPAPDNVDPEGARTAPLRGQCRARRYHGHGVAGGFAPPAPRSSPTRSDSSPTVSRRPPARTGSTITP